jgi:anti-sigma B factor antagonist
LGGSLSGFCACIDSLLEQHPFASLFPIVNSFNRILAGDLNGVVWLRVQGKGSFEISTDLNRFASAQMADGRQHFVVDLESCPTMDSTFMGTLTGIAIRLQQRPGGRLQIVNPNERNCELMSNLGLDHIFEVDAVGEAWQLEKQLISASLTPAQVDEGAESKKERCEHIRNAHQTLSDICPSNAPKFRDVIDCLNRELATI